MSRLQALAIVTALVCGAAGCSKDKDSTTGSSGSGSTSAFNYLAGNWSGTWTDQRYNVSGTLEATFIVNGSSVSATGTIGLASLNIAGLTSATGSGTGVVSGNTLSFSFASTALGSGTGTLNPANGGSGAGTVTVANFGGFTFSGTTTSSTIAGTFQFTSPTGGNGVASLTKK